MAPGYQRSPTVMLQAIGRFSYWGDKGLRTMVNIAVSISQTFPMMECEILAAHPWQIGIVNPFSESRTLSS